MVDAANLLSRTVVYKVGHHGSHNATLSDKGLEIMTGPDLIGLIPVNTDTAQKKRWSMPYPPLRARLEELSDDRTYLADTGVEGLQNGEEQQLPNAVIRQEALYLDVELTR